jgi:hypothetical protein
MNIIPFDGSAVKENDRYNGRFLPSKFRHLGSLVKFLGDRAGVDSFFFRFRIGIVNPQDLFNIGFLDKYYGDYKFYRLRLDDGNIDVEYHQNPYGAFFEISVYSLTQFYKNRSSAVFANYLDYLAALHELKDCVNRAVPIFGNCFNPFECENSRHDQFGDLMFLSRRKSDMKKWFTEAKTAKIEGLPYTYEFVETKRDRAGFGWMNCPKLNESTEFLKMYFKESRDKDRPKGAEFNPFKIRIEHSYQKPAALRDALSNDLGLAIEDSYHLRDLTRRGQGYAIENPHLNNAFNLCRPETINRLFWLPAKHLFATAEAV